MSGLLERIRDFTHWLDPLRTVPERGLAALLGASGGAGKVRTALKVGPGPYKSIGVKPVINCR